MRVMISFVIFFTIMFSVGALLVGIGQYFQGRKDSLGQDAWMAEPIQVGGNPLFWIWDKAYAAGFYSARKGE